MAGIAVLEKGTEHALKVILIHAFPFNKAMWKHQVEGLGSKAHVMAIDLPGFGMTPTYFPTGVQSLKDHAYAIKSFMEMHGIEKAVLGGCSWGGYILYETWKAYPSLFSGLMLIDTRMEADTPEAIEKRKQNIATIRSNGFFTDFMAEAQVPFLLADSLLKAKDTDKHAAEVIEYAKDAIKNTAGQSVIDGQNAIMNRPDSTDLLPTINVPTLIIVGSEDKASPPALAQAMKAKLPEATSKLEIIEGAGHLSPLEKPDQVNEKILNFLQTFKFL